MLIFPFPFPSFLVTGIMQLASLLSQKMNWQDSAFAGGLSIKKAESYYWNIQLTNYLKFGIQAIIHGTYDLINRPLVHYSGQGLNKGPFDKPSKRDDLNTELVKYSDPHFTVTIWILDTMGIRYSHCKVKWLGRTFKYWTFWTINMLFLCGFSDHYLNIQIVTVLFLKPTWN